MAAGRTVSAPWLDGSHLYALESRPADGGRVMIIRRDADGGFVDAIPTGFNVRSRVHEYGGGAYTAAGGVLVFTNHADNLLYRGQGPDRAPIALTRSSDQRFADLVLDLPRDRVLAVLEDHTSAAGGEPVNAIAAVSLADGAVEMLVGGHDFFSNPRLDPTGGRLAWITWDRPNMPWDGTQLWVADVGMEGSIGDARLVAGGPDESVLDPTWAPDGSLLFLSDRTGWWNPYRWVDGTPAPVALAPMDAECADAQWVFGMRWLGVDADGTAVVVTRTDAGDRLQVLAAGGPRPIDVAATELMGLLVQDGHAFVIAAGPTQATALVRVRLRDGALEPLYTPSPLAVDAAFLSTPRLVEFPTAHGRTAFAWYYPPTNPDAVAPPGTLPPLIVASHGGPTGRAGTGLDLVTQAFTSRGFAVVDVDYGGSTGHGRAYRDRLRGQWGVVDLEDCCAAATWLAAEGMADPARLAIRGGSAGGYTTLSALTFRDTFAAGTSYFGVGDLEALARDTHKFESRYLDLLVGPYPSDVDRYRDRSPIHAVGRISCPVLVLQGEDDRVVPKEQAEEIVDALAERGVPHAYLLFAGEGHGFRKPENRRRALEAELSFYAQVFGFELADPIEPVQLSRPGG